MLKIKDERCRKEKEKFSGHQATTLKTSRSVIS
jgi:hypothetical protein